MRPFFTTFKRPRGFAILYAVLVASIVITVGLSLLDISTRETTLSFFGLESQKAFYAAESGLECALYWDIRGRNGISVFATSTPGLVECASQGVGTNTQTVPTNPSVPSLIGGGGNTNPTSIFYLDFNRGSKPLPYCVIVTVTKFLNTNNPNLLPIATDIIARGYNTCDTTNPRRVERTVETIY